MKCIIFYFLVFVNLLISQTQQDKTLYDLAEAVEKAGNYEQALRFYEDLHKKFPINYDYFNGSIRCLSYLKQYDEAISRSISWIEKNPGDISTNSQIGSLYLRSGNFSKGDSVWKSILSNKNVSSFHISVVAEYQMKERLPDKAIETFIEGRKILKTPNQFRLEIAQLYFYTMNYTLSVREHILYLKENPQQLDFIQSRFSQITSKPDGLKAALSVFESENLNNKNESNISETRLYLWLLLEAKKYNEATIIAKQINSEIKSGGEELYQFALRLYKEKVYSNSLSLFKEIILQYPNFNRLPEVYYFYTQSMENILRDENSTQIDSTISYEIVMNSYRSIINKYPNHVNTQIVIGKLASLIFETQNDPQTALQLVDSLLRVTSFSPSRVSTMILSAKFLISIGELNKAEGRYNESILLPNISSSEKLEINFRLAKLNYYLNRFDSAIAILQMIGENYSVDEANDALRLQYFIIENKGKHQKLLKIYSGAELLVEQNKMSEAIEYFKTLQNEKAPLVDDALMQIGKINYKIKRYKEAVLSYQNFIEKFTSSILLEQIYFLLANIFENNLFDNTKALYTYQQLIEKFPNSIYADESRKRIRIIRGDAI